jgi:ribonuclease P protein subunit RPR2
MSATSVVKYSGRKGRRTGAMVRIARDRVSKLFALAERESLGSHPELADRYVHLARRIGMRYNVRLLPEYRELYCRSCSAYWVEARTVRTRLRSGMRVKTCLRCGRQRRTRIGRTRPDRTTLPAPGFRSVRRDEGALSVSVSEEADGTDEETEDE